MACNSSGVINLTSSQITPDRCKLVSVHASKASGTGTIRIFDGTSTSGKEIVRILFDASKQTAVEFDMHGAIANDGLFLDNPDQIYVSVEFA
tara:strand:- start:237 stop:512 length:276 start_codon:yes stop_codon:yes gene_type:complete